VYGFKDCEESTEGETNEFSAKNALKLWSSSEVKLKPLPIDEIEAISYCLRAPNDIEVR
jgi:hypothetical protein